MVLVFSPRSVMKIEKELKLPLTTIVGVYSMETLVLFVKHGLGVSEDIALEEIDKAFKEGKDMLSLYLDILETLQAGGFLPKALKIQDIRAKMENPEEISI